MTETLPSGFLPYAPGLLSWMLWLQMCRRPASSQGLSQELGKEVDGLDRALTQCRVLVDGV